MTDDAQDAQDASPAAEGTPTGAGSLRSGDRVRVVGEQSDGSLSAKVTGEVTGAFNEWGAKEITIRPDGESGTREHVRPRPERTFYRLERGGQ